MAIPTRIASIDIGSNTVVTLIAEAQGNTWHPLVEREAITRLAEGLTGSGELSATAVARTAHELGRSIDEARALRASTILASGTAPFRRARNGAAVATELSQRFDVPLQVLSGTEEAELARVATRSAFPEIREPLILDIGGASTELIIDADDVLLSLDLGAVRLTEKGVTQHPVPRHERVALRASIDQALAEHAQACRGAAAVMPLVGIAGTVTSLAAIELALPTYDAERVHGHVMSRAQVHALTQRLLDMDVAARAALPSLNAKRADVIAAGALLLDAIMDFTHAAEVRVSDRGVRWGRLWSFVHAKGPTHGHDHHHT